MFIPVSNMHTENPMPLRIETSRIRSVRTRRNCGVTKFPAMSSGKFNYILKYPAKKLNMQPWPALWEQLNQLMRKGLNAPFRFPYQVLTKQAQLITSIDLLYSWLRIFAINSSVNSETHCRASPFSSSLHSLAATSLRKNQCAGASKTPKNSPASFLL